ncbi:MAG: hypothetical protein ACYC7L_02210 [Nitrospirota bacterium]
MSWDDSSPVYQKWSGQGMKLLEHYDSDLINPYRDLYAVIRVKRRRPSGN